MNIYKEGEDLMSVSTFENLIGNYFNSHVGDDTSLVDNVLQALQEDVIVLVDEANEWDCFVDDITKILAV